MDDQAVGPWKQGFSHSRAVALDADFQGLTAFRLRHESAGAAKERRNVTLAALRVAAASSRKLRNDPHETLRFVHKERSRPKPASCCLHAAGIERRRATTQVVLADQRSNGGVAVAVHPIPTPVLNAAERDAALNRIATRRRRAKGRSQQLDGQTIATREHRPDFGLIGALNSQFRRAAIRGRHHESAGTSKERRPVAFATLRAVRAAY